MSFTFMDIVTILGFFCTGITILLGIIKFVSSQIHARITAVEDRLDSEIKDIKDNYAHKDTIEQGIEQINKLVSAIQLEQHRMAQRMDDFLKWLVQIQSKDKP